MACVESCQSSIPWLFVSRIRRSIHTCGGHWGSLLRGYLQIFSMARLLDGEAGRLSWDRNWILLLILYLPPSLPVALCCLLKLRFGHSPLGRFGHSTPGTLVTCSLGHFDLDLYAVG